MTRDEAIKDIRENIKPIVGGKSLDMAIKALERNRGEWMPHEDEDGEHYGDNCSECGEWYVMPYGKTNFCPNCGAEMRGEKNG